MTRPTMKRSLDFIKDKVGLSGRQILKKSVNYAISHKVQWLGVKHRFIGHISQIPATTLSGSNIYSLKHVDSDTKVYPRYENLRVLNWLSRLANIKSLTVSTTFLQNPKSNFHLFSIATPLFTRPLSSNQSSSLVSDVSRLRVAYQSRSSSYSDWESSLTHHGS
ncbi:hypothetical protein QL285_064985 [Trifolium repens]|nr:hypothetical protein QL285_064985 [Trifolium repens]